MKDALFCGSCPDEPLLGVSPLGHRGLLLHTVHPLTQNRNQQE
jgi:hypothetical protein